MDKNPLSEIQKGMASLGHQRFQILESQNQKAQTDLSHQNLILETQNQLILEPSHFAKSLLAKTSLKPPHLTKRNLR
jgi:hypothetical protein